MQWSLTKFAAWPIAAQPLPEKLLRRSSRLSPVKSNGVKIGSEVQAGFLEIAEITGKFKSMVQNIERSSSESANQFNSVSDALNHLDGISQRTAVAAEENAAAVAGMDGQADKIRDYAHRLARMVEKQEGELEGSTLGLVSATTK